MILQFQGVLLNEPQAPFFYSQIAKEANYTYDYDKPPKKLQENFTFLALLNGSLEAVTVFHI